MAFDQTTRNRLQKFVTGARQLLSDEFTQQLQNTYGMDPSTGNIAEFTSLPSLSPSQQQTAKLLRDTLEHYLAANHKAKLYADKNLVIASLERIVREQAFTILNRLAALRMAEARQFVLESISQSYQSKGFQLYQRIAGSALGETGQTYQNYLFSVFDELSLDLNVLFDRYSSQGRLFPRETVLLELLDLINHDELEQLWAEDETVGWIYQYFNSKEERKKMRDESQAPRNSRELAVRNQFFTPRYVVEFLTDNTLGRIWYEMTKGQTALINSCQYLVRRPNEVFLKLDEAPPEQQQDETELSQKELSQEELLQQTVYIQYRPLKDPRDIKMLDPACGSMHFGLYAFDLFEQIYSEAWDLEESNDLGCFLREPHNGEVRPALHQSYDSKEIFLADVPKLIIENNIHGVDIDPRVAQIAGLSLWLRAQKSWIAQNIQPNQRPQIQRSNIVCAEPMPGEIEILKEFTSDIQPKVLGQLVEVIFDKMQLAGEAGTLLKIEEEIQIAIEEAKEQSETEHWTQDNLFGEHKQVQEELRYSFDDGLDDNFWNEVEFLILAELERYAESAGNNGSSQKRLFAKDAAKGFAFIDLCRKRFDVVLMNPPFGDPAPKCSEYFEINYKNYNKNILCAFIIRALNWSNTGVFVGVIYDKTVLIKSTYEKFRRSYLIPDSRLSAHVDLGWGVLDANVEVACSTFDTYQNISREGCFFNVRDIDVDRKNQIISNSISSFSSFQVNEQSSIIDAKDFLSFPNAVLGYDFPIFARNTFKLKEPLNKYVTLFEGHTLKSEVFFRYWWEVPINEEISSKSKWRRMYNGGGYQRFVSPLCDVVCLGVNSKLVSSHRSSVLRNINLQGKGVIGFGKRGEFVDTHIVPNGFISTVEGKHVVIHKNISPFVILALLNSKTYQYLINLYCGQHKYPGYVGILPVPELDSCTNMDEAGKYCEELFTLIDSLQSMEEISPKYGDIGNINIWNKKCSGDIKEYLSKIQNLEDNINKAIFEAYNLSSSDRKLILKYCTSEPNQNGWWQNYSEEIIKIKLSFIFGTMFERWIVENKKLKNKRKLEYLAELPSQPPLLNTHSCHKEILVLEKGMNQSFIDTFEKLVGDIQESLSESNILSNLIADVYKQFKIQSIDEYYNNYKIFFESHLKLYSKNNRQAPIYWPLQTSSGLYTIWLYYHCLNEQTLFTCINNSIEPKLSSLTVDIDVLQKNINRSIKQESQLEKLINFENELRDFYDELLLITYYLLLIAKYWSPNLNDGVQITAAPLWKLFQHKSWQKKLQTTWKDLEQGKLDWSHMAYNIWPERVLKKCHQDRSIAIAHDVENDLWEEIEVPAKRGKGTKLQWQPKQITDTELNTYIQEKIANK